MKTQTWRVIDMTTGRQVDTVIAKTARGAKQAMSKKGHDNRFHAVLPEKVKSRKLRQLVIAEDRLGDWRITLYFNRGRYKTLDGTYDNHQTACLAASGTRFEQSWEGPQ